eukprot:jgi/Psemu1/25732/gm1.25732_g
MTMTTNNGEKETKSDQERQQETEMIAKLKRPDNKRNNQIPDSFPGMVLIMDTGNVNSENRYRLHKDYQRKNSPEFQYFMKRILGAVSPKQTDFKRKSFRTTTSNIFTPINNCFSFTTITTHG